GRGGGGPGRRGWRRRDRGGAGGLGGRCRGRGRRRRCRRRGRGRSRGGWDRRPDQGWGGGRARRIERPRPGLQVADLLGLGRQDRGRGLRRRGRGGPALDQLFDLVAHLRLDAAQLILHVDAVRAAEVEQVFTLQIQLTRQFVDTDFFFRQAGLLERRHTRVPSTTIRAAQNPQLLILTTLLFLKRGEQGQRGSRIEDRGSKIEDRGSNRKSALAALSFDPRSSILDPRSSPR